MSEKWSLSGTYFEACNCNVACPCVFLSEPTPGECTVLVGWHIDEGTFEGTSLNNLNVALGSPLTGSYDGGAMEGRALS